MQRDKFIERYGGIYEHSLWVAEETFAEDLDSANSDELAGLFADCVDNATLDRRLALIRVHPDLAGRATISGELTDESTNEQSSAGIDQCTAEEFARFQDTGQTNCCEHRYREKQLCSIEHCCLPQIQT